jgi:hypothetical protein
MDLGTPVRIGQKWDKNRKFLLLNIFNYFTATELLCKAALLSKQARKTL